MEDIHYKLKMLQTCTRQYIMQNYNLIHVHTISTTCTSWNITSGLWWPLSLTISEFNCVPHLQRSTGKTFFIKLKTSCSKLTADSTTAELAHEEPLNMGIALESRIMQNSSKESWLNCSASVTISSSSSSLPWEALVSDRLELDRSSLKNNKI